MTNLFFLLLLKCQTKTIVPIIKIPKADEIRINKSFINFKESMIKGTDGSLFKTKLIFLFS
jgi:hypothetical protein